MTPLPPSVAPLRHLDRRPPALRRRAAQARIPLVAASALSSAGAVPTIVLRLRAVVRELE